MQNNPGHKKIKVAIIELGSSHDECIYTQIKILKSANNIHLSLICNEKLRDRVAVYDLTDKKVFVSIRNNYKQWIDIYRLWKFCKQEAFDKIIFNTAQGQLVSRLLRFPFGKNTKFYGTLHNIRKISKSHSQKIISKKVKRYFVLSEYLKQKSAKTNKTNLSFEVFYPIFFPEYPQIPIDKKDNEIWICIPGQVELKRRDYKSLFQSIEKFGINEDIKFLLLGSYGHAHGDGSYIKEEINKLSVSSHFMTWEKFIPVDFFHSMIAKSDYILPLIHKGDKSGELYEYQISGAYNLAVGYKKPLLIEEEINNMLLDYQAIVYQKNSLMQTINKLGKNKPGNYYNDKKWRFDYQKQTYLKHIGINTSERNHQ